MLPDIPSALKYGVIGLGAILAVLAFYLLIGEQKRSKARPQILNAVYLFMVFSLVLVVLGIVAQSFQHPSLPGIGSASGFDNGALNGTWLISGQDVDLPSEGFQARYRYSGSVVITHNGTDVQLEGTLKTIFLSTDSLRGEADLRVTGILNNNYCAGYYHYGNHVINGFGSMLIMFNHAANEGRSCVIFRPTTGTTLFGNASLILRRQP